MDTPSNTKGQRNHTATKTHCEFSLCGDWTSPQVKKKKEIAAICKFVIKFLKSKPL